MASLRRTLLFGFLVWLIPFVVAVAVFPVKASSRSLFESIMAVTLAATVVVCALRYFRSVRSASMRDGVLVGVVWLAISVAIDLPLMLNPPINYTFAEYCADVALTYMMIPIITAGIASAAATPAARAHAVSGT